MLYINKYIQYIHTQNIVGVVAWQLRFQTSPPGTPVYCWFLLGVSCYLPLPGICRSVGLPVMQLRKNSVSMVSTRLQLIPKWCL